MTFDDGFVLAGRRMEIAVSITVLLILYADTQEHEAGSVEMEIGN
jgi:hypothetical protein